MGHPALSDLLAKGARHPLVVLGALLLAARWIVPQQVYPWITLASGVVIAVVGGRVVAREVRSRLPFAHRHAHEHAHAHPHSHDHVHLPGEHHHGGHTHAIPGTALSAISLVARPRFGRVARNAPLVTAIAIATVGAVMVGEGFAALGVAVPIPLVAVLVLAAIGGYAFAFHRHDVPTEAHA